MGVGQNFKLSKPTPNDVLSSSADTQNLLKQSHQLGTSVQISFKAPEVSVKVKENIHEGKYPFRRDP